MGSSPYLGVFTVVYSGEPDEVFAFAEDGQSRTFGRDDAHCDIVIWSAINGRDLSRMAGRIWRMSDELWIRNLSTRHELFVVVPGLPPEPALPPRRPDGVDPGPARSLPPGVTFVRGPGGCELVVRQHRSIDQEPADVTVLGDATVHVPPVPDRLRPVAAALCEPLLRGGQLPASYSEIDRRAGLGSLKRARNLVADLCSLYVHEVPLLRERIVARLREEEQRLELPVNPRLHRGVWTFEAASREDDPDEVRRRRALALPDYYEVAHLLVRRRLVVGDDLAILTAGGADSNVAAAPGPGGDD